VLIIQTPPSAEAEWAEQGWPAVLPTEGDREEPELFGWAMRTIGPAVRASDWPVVEDLVDEGNMWLSRIRAASYSVPDPALRPFLSITDTMWPEVLRAVGGRDRDRLPYAARLLSKLCGVADVVGRRPAKAVPAYVPLAERPFLTAGGATRPGPAGQFLADLAAVLSTGQGHLVDVASPLRLPAGRLPAAMGWRSAIEPQGVSLGSLDTTEGTLRLRTRVVAQVLASFGDQGTDLGIESDIGEALAAAWLIDTTLIVNPPWSMRVAGVIDTWWDDSGAELIWRLPDVLLGGGTGGVSPRG
jgi:hypothetical protein